MRVLIVEDQPDLADDIADGLRDQGIGADVAYDGAAALEKALMNPYDVMIARPGPAPDPWRRGLRDAGGAATRPGS